MLNGQTVIAIIPARGGSKRIPKKNIMPLAGKEMIAWTIEAAKASRYIDKLLVSTDSEEIKTVSIKHGAQVPFLRQEAIDDFTPVSEATLAALKQAEKMYGQFDVVLQLMPNCPLRTTEDIDVAIESFIINKQSSQVSFFKFGWMNPWWAHSIKEGKAIPIFKEAIAMRSQDLDKLFCPTGCIWISKTEVLDQYKTFYSPGYSPHEISWISALDIDNYDDVQMAEALFFMQTQNKTIKLDNYS